ncbi:uncharacterized protein TNCV_2204851 [Trichonephila clavipes]|nr:uncharacterized protein TNCV_2204851 [Trichonephila clavipes]
MLLGGLDAALNPLSELDSLETLDFVTRTIVRVGRYLNHCSCKDVNSWFMCKQDATSNKIPVKMKMDRLKFKLEIVEALLASPPTNKITPTTEDNSLVIPLAKRSKRYNPPHSADLKTTKAV